MAAIFWLDLSTPIPQPASRVILGMHTSSSAPVVVDDRDRHPPNDDVALSYGDHRIVDGREAVTFLVRIKQASEDPEAPSELRSE